MFTDMVGYTALGQRNESLSLALVEEQRKLIRAILSKHNGREIKTMGDAFLVEFPSALDAVKCAYDIQRATREFNVSLPEDQRLHLRVGVHVGDVVEAAGDISGDAVNIASRIEPLAEDGGVCLTSNVYDQVSNKFELSLASLGLKTLKNVKAPVRIYKMVMPWDKRKAVSISKFNPKRIAILPFTNISADQADEYFADGMTEELISVMSNIAGLKVISRTSVMQFKKTTKSVAEIAQDLSTGSILEGSVRKSGLKVRVTAQLIDVNTDTHVWSKNYDREIKDIFEIQGDISLGIAESVRVRLLPVERKRVQKEATSSVDAHLLYMKGRYYWNERTKASLEKAIGYFEKAIKKDPAYALAYSGLSDTYSVMSDHGYMSRSKAHPLALKNAETAVKLDPNLSDAHASLGLALIDARDYQRSAHELERAIQINPNNSSAHMWYSRVAITNRARSDIGQAMRSAENAVRLDPLNLIAGVGLGWGYYYLHRLDEAISQLRKVIDLSPEFPLAHLWLAMTHLLKGEPEQAIREARTLDRVYPVKSFVGVILAGVGRAQEAREIADGLEQSNEYVDPADLAWLYGLLGDREKTIEWLSHAIEEDSAHLDYFVLDPSLRDCRKNPRVGALLKKAGFSTYTQ